MEKKPLHETEEFKRGFSNRKEIVPHKVMLTEENLQLIRIDIPDFWSICDELEKEMDDYGRSFWSDRNELLLAFQEERMFTLSASKLNQLDYYNYTNHIFLKKTFYTLPCFLVVGEDGVTVEYIWVAERAKRMGLASFLIKKSKVKRVENIVFSKESLIFWLKKRERNGLKFDDTTNEMLDSFSILFNDRPGSIEDIDEFDTFDILKNFSDKRAQPLSKT